EKECQGGPKEFGGLTCQGNVSPRSSRNFLRYISGSTPLARSSSSVSLPISRLTRRTSSTTCRTSPRYRLLSESLNLVSPSTSSKQSAIFSQNRSQRICAVQTSRSVRISSVRD